MALVATIQVLLDCSEAQLANKLKQVSEVLQSVDIVMDVRTLDHHGAPLASYPCAEAFSAVLHDSYSPGAAWSTERFVVPHGKVQLDPLELGCLEVRVPEGHGASQAAVDVRIHRTEEGVSVSLLPAGRADVPLSDQNRAELSFATSRSLQGFCPVPATEGMEGRLYDVITGRPLMGPALLVPARGRYDLAVALKGGGFHLTQLRVEDSFEAMARQGTCENGSGVLQRMYFNDEGALIPESRVELRPLFQGITSGGQHG